MEFLLLFVILIALWVGVSPQIAAWILRPLVPYADDLQTPRRFLLSDLIWLMLQLQAVIAAGVQIFDRSVPLATRLFILLVFCVPVVAIWSASLHVASRAGIYQPLRRGAVVLLVIPLGMTLAVALPVLFAALLVSLGRAVELGDRQIWVAGPLFALGVVVARLLRWLADWSVGESRPARDDMAVTR